MNRVVPFAVAAAVVVLSIIGLAYLADRNVAAPHPSLVPMASTTASPAAMPSLPELGLPGTRADEAGEWGWTAGATGGPGGMHWVVGDREVAAMSFAAAPNCLRAGEDQATPVRIAGLDVVVVEPYEPPVGFGGLDGDETTRAYALAVGDRTLCVYVTWHATTTAAERQTTLDILDTIKAQPFGEMSVRITFTLPAGWDTG